MHFKIRHSTHYDYEQLVDRAINLAYLLPRSTTHQTCHKKQLEIFPYPTTKTIQTDYFGNEFCHFTVEQQHESLTVIAESHVETSVRHDWPSLNIGNTCQQVREKLAGSSEVECILAREYIQSSPLVKHNAEFAKYAKPIFSDNKPFLSAVREFCAKIYCEFVFDSEFSQVNTPLTEVFLNRRGVCQDFTQFAIACLRTLGYPAGYVSGYLETIPPPGTQKLVGSDATHAWVAVFSPGEGWFQFDPTNNVIPSEQHIVNAWGRDYSDVTPLRGVVIGGGSTNTLKVSVDVARSEMKVNSNLMMTQQSQSS